MDLSPRPENVDERDLQRALLLLDGVSSKEGDAYVKRRYHRLQWTTSPENRQIIKDFVDHMKARQFKTGTILRYIPLLREVAFKLGKNLKEADADDIRQVILYFDKRVKEGSLKLSSKIKNIATIKSFYKWVNPKLDLSEYSTKIQNGSITHGDLIKPEELAKLIDLCEHLRDKALLGALYATGARIGELLAMRNKDIIFDQYGCKLRLRGKTGERTCRVVEFTPILAEYQKNHPLRNNGEAAFWFNYGTRQHGQPMNYGAVQTLFANLNKLNPIGKKIYPHLFRHSAASRFGVKMPEQVSKQYFGWGKNSRMLDRYISLSGNESDDVILKLSGVKKDDDEPIITSKVCVFCEQKNIPYADQCSRCGRPLSEKRAVEMEKEKNAQESELLSIMLRTSDVKTLLTAFKKLSEKVEQMEKS